MIDRLAIFGATGDLTARYLLPALGSLRASGHLGDRFQLTGAGREDWDDDEFRRWASAQLDRHAGHLPRTARDGVVSAAHYRLADAGDPASVAAVGLAGAAAPASADPIGKGLVMYMQMGGNPGDGATWNAAAPAWPLGPRAAGLR